MMVFVDTSFWYSYYVKCESRSAECQRLLIANAGRLVTTDYVIDELLTLLSARGLRDLACEAGDELWSEQVCDLIWVKWHQVRDAWRVFSTYRDKEWSFTDCVSYAVMKELGIRDAFALDDHFRQFGFANVQP